jgi:hypothetical protein
MGYEVTYPLTRPLGTARGSQAGWWTDLCSRTSPAGCARLPTSLLVPNGAGRCLEDLSWGRFWDGGGCEGRCDKQPLKGYPRWGISRSWLSERCSVVNIGERMDAKLASMSCLDSETIRINAFAQVQYTEGRR